MFVPQAIHDLQVSAVCNPYNRFGPISVFDVSFDLTYPVEKVTLSVRKSDADGTFGPWMPAGPTLVYLHPQLVNSCMPVRA